MLLITKRVSYGAMFVAMGIILSALVHFPLFPSCPWLEYDMGDVPLLLSAAILGPWSGLLITLVTCIVQGITVSANSGVIGIIMHFLTTGSAVLIIGYIVRDKNKFKTVIAFVLCIIVWVLMSVPFNLIFTPAFAYPDSVFKTIYVCAKDVVKTCFKLPNGIWGVVTVLSALFMFVATICTVMLLCRDKIKVNKNNKDIPTFKAFVNALGIVRFIIIVVIAFILAMFLLLLMNLLLADVELNNKMLNAFSIMFKVIIPFNLIKASLNSLLSCVAYLSLGRIMNLENIMKAKK